jgi:hypothetical protein
MNMGKLTLNTNLLSSDVAADKTFLSRQREILRLLNKVHEPNRFKDQAELGLSYEPTAHLSRYKVREHRSTRLHEHVQYQGI